MTNPLIFYYAPTACSIAPHIALEEVGVEFEPRPVELSKDELNAPDFLKLSPLGRVPTMIIDGEGVTEVPALLTYIASLKPQLALTPPPGSLAYARCFEWLGFLSSTLHVAYAQFRRPERFLTPGSPGWDELSHQGRLNAIAFYREVERRLSDGWAAGDAYSIADIYLFPFFTWTPRLEFDVRKECPKWARLFYRVKQRPAVQRAVEREGITV
jgi:glutathione S-transferase